MLDLDERGSALVAGTPESEELLPRLDRPRGRSEQARQLERAMLRVGVEHAYGQLGLDGFAEAIAGLEPRAIEAHGEPDRRFGAPGGVGAHLSLVNSLAFGPGGGIGRIGRS